jgi:hypothetical protein
MATCWNIAGPKGAGKTPEKAIKVEWQDILAGGGLLTITVTSILTGKIHL